MNAIVVNNVIKFILRGTTYYLKTIDGPVHEISILIASASSKCSGGSAHMLRLARAFIAHIQESMDEVARAKVKTSGFAGYVRICVDSKTGLKRPLKNRQNKCLILEVHKTRIFILGYRGSSKKKCPEIYLARVYK